MLIFIYGKNTYLAAQKVAAMRERFVEKFDASGMNLAEFDIAVGAGSPCTLGDVLQAVQSPPFLGEKRMVIIRGLLSLKKADAEPWGEALSRIPETTITIVVDDVSAKMGAKHFLVKSLGSSSDVHEYVFDELEGAELMNWARREAAELGLKIDAALLQQVVAMVGSDLWQLSGELKKLAAYSKNRPVTQEVVRDLVRANFEDQIFAFIDAVAAKNSRQALSLLDAQRLAGSTDHHLFSMLARQVRLLLSARDVLDRNPAATKADVASALGVHPFVAQKSLAQARNMQMERLRELHDMLFELDGLIKTGTNAEVVVDRLVAVMVL